jgi:serine/threonine protein kinase/predicted Zn-dependent protease
MIGQTISHYHIREKLGEGGMGIIYKAEDTKLKRKVVLKFLPPGLTGTPEAKARFFIEAQAEAALNHANIVTVHEIDEHDNRVYIAMEYVQGKNLKQKIASGPLEIEEVLNIAVQAAEGLQEAHEKGIIHRDIKSANIMLNEKGQVKILDFGLARLKGQTQLTKDGSTVGTAAYMSPEQAQGAIVDYRSDIWSLGVVLFEMLTGHLPFRGENEQAVIYSILNKEPEPISSLRPDVPPELESIINKALTKETFQRYKNAAELWADLSLCKENVLPGVAPSTQIADSDASIKTLPKSMFLAAILLVLVMTAGYFLFKGKPQPGRPVIEPVIKPSLAVVFFENISGDERLDSWRSAFSELITIDLSQSKYVRVLRSDETYGILKKLNLLEAKKYSTEDLKEISKEGEVNHILKGTYIKAGDHFAITTVLIDTDNGKTIGSLSVKAEGEKNIFPKVDELTKGIKLQLNIPSKKIINDIDRNIAMITSSYPGALRPYFESRKRFAMGELRESIRLMEKAVSIDPGFAMAYRSMAFTYGYLDNRNRYKYYIRKAMETSHRLSDRELYLIRGDYYSLSEKTYDKAIKAYQTLQQLYPDELTGNHNLGGVYYKLEEWDKAIEQFEKYRKIKAPHFLHYTSLAQCYCAKRMFNKSLEILEEYRERFPDNVQTHEEFIATFISMGKFNQALHESDQFPFDLTNDYHYWSRHLTRGDIYFFKGDLKKAEKMYTKLLPAKEPGAVGIAKKRLISLELPQGRIGNAKKQAAQMIEWSEKINEIYWELISRQYNAYLFFKSKNFHKALEEYEKMWHTAVQDENLDKQRHALMGKGLSYLEMNVPVKAMQTADELKQLIDAGMNKKSMAMYYLLMGGIELKRNRISQSIEYFNKAIPLVSYEPWAILLDYLARAYSKNGNLDKAAETYEKIRFLAYNRRDNGDIYAKSFFHLGKIYQQKGLTVKAIENYNRFIRLWQECDPVFQPLVKDARKRVAQLTKTSGRNKSS